MDGVQYVRHGEGVIIARSSLDGGGCCEEDGYEGECCLGVRDWVDGEEGEGEDRHFMSVVR